MLSALAQGLLRSDSFSLVTFLSPLTFSPSNQSKLPPIPSYLLELLSYYATSPPVGAASIEVKALGLFADGMA